MSGPSFTPLVASLPSNVPFVGPEAQERARGGVFDARIGANESVFGPSPRAIEAMAAATQDVWKYGDPDIYDLRHALARHHDVAPENIVVGEGIDGLLGSLARMFVLPGTKVATSLGAYPTFNYHIVGFGGELCTVPYRDDREDLDALLEISRERSATIVYVANPDNPMGTWHSAKDIQAFIDKLPDGILFCLDEAYIEFAEADVAPALDVSDPRIIRFRTFSKAHGMAGARIGYGIGEASLIKAFDKIRNHFGVNRIAQAGALAALADPTYIDEVRSKVRAARMRIAEIASNNGLSSLPSATNFVAVDCGGDVQYAKSIVDELISQGVFVRMPFVAPQNRCIRISAGTDRDLDLLAAALPKAISAAQLARSA